MNPARVLRHVVIALACSFSGRAASKTPLDVPFFQQEKNGCGAASVAMVAHYWGARLAKAPAAVPPPKQVYERLYLAERLGISLADMKRYLEELGYNAFTFHGEWNDLTGQLSNGRPIIVGLKNRRSERLHFAVVVGMEGDHVWLNDPTRGKPNRIKQSDFEKQWKSGDRWLLLAAPSRPE